MTDDELTAAQEAEAEPEAEPQPMPKRPTWQVVSWLGGVAAGGTLIALLTLSPTRLSGATRAFRLRWQQHCGRTGEVLATQGDWTAQEPKAPTVDTEATGTAADGGAAPAAGL